MLDRKSEEEFEFEPEAIDDTDEVDLETVEEATSDKVKAVKDKLKECESEKMSHLEELQRVKADFLNARKRLEEEKQREKIRTKRTFIEDLLPLCDSFHMAMGNTDAWNKVDEDWRKGVESIHAQLERFLKEHNVTTLNPLGEAFDPAVHDAMSNQSVNEESKHDTIITVIQPGYAMEVGEETEVIRPSRVIVGEFTKE